MEARIISWVALAISILACNVSSATGSDYTTDNFSVQAPSPQFARQVGDLAEKYRRELAIHWLGHELPKWPERCPITVEIKQHAGGETSFMFMPDHTGRSAPSRWQMSIFGSPERILDSVLPHEVTHTIFATHFGRPLPRWADEGACTTVEHKSEKAKNHRMLIEFLQHKRGIPFNHMFAMKQYPQDILPLYAQGHSLVKYLIMQKGEKHFIKFLGEGMQNERSRDIPGSWNGVMKQYYGFDDLSDLQVSWIKWVGDGSRELPRTDELGASEAIASRGGDSKQEDARTDDHTQPVPAPARQISSNSNSNSTDRTHQASAPGASANQNYYMEQMRLGKTMAQSEQPVAKRFREQAFTSTIGYHPGTISQSMPVGKLDENRTAVQSDSSDNYNGYEYHAEVTRGTIWR